MCEAVKQLQSKLVCLEGRNEEEKEITEYKDRKKGNGEEMTEDLKGP